MRYLSERASWVIFVFSAGVLIVLAIVSNAVTSRYEESEKWVAHTREVETWVARARADLLSAESGRLAFVLSDDENRLAQYASARQTLTSDIDHLRSLTADNPSQGQRLNAMRPIIDRKFNLMDDSIALHKTGKPDAEQQKILTRNCGPLTIQAVDILNAMRAEENNLLAQRIAASKEKYNWVRLVLLIAFAVAILLLYMIFRRLLVELNDRKLAEAAVRRLTSRVLDLQDTERRKVAREIHDSIGQYFAGLMMNLTILKDQHASLGPQKTDAMLADSLDLTQRGMAEARTMSHLLHPPLLDEVGFASAARWYVEGFTQRSGVQVALEIPADLDRLPREIELVLFRTLQEGLTNVHKHSGSSSALVSLGVTSGSVTLKVQDSGRGVPQKLLSEFERTTSGTGVGLAGMRERVRDLGGQFVIRSEGSGTVLEVTLPVATEPSVESTPGPAHGTSVTPVTTASTRDGRPRGSAQLLIGTA